MMIKFLKNNASEEIKMETMNEIIKELNRREILDKKECLEVDIYQIRRGESFSSSYYYKILYKPKTVVKGYRPEECKVYILRQSKFQTNHNYPEVEEMEKYFLEKFIMDLENDNVNLLILRQQQYDDGYGLPPALKPEEFTDDDEDYLEKKGYDFSGKIE